MAQSFYPVYLVTQGYSPTDIGLLFSLMYLASTLTAPLYGRVTHFVSGGRMIWVSAGLSIVGICLLPLSHGTLSVCLLTVIHGAGTGFSLPSLMSEIAGRTGESERGRAISLRVLFHRLRSLVTPLMLGWSVANFGLAVSFYGAGVVMATLMLLGMTFEWAQQANN